MHSRLTSQAIFILGAVLIACATLSGCVPPERRATALSQSKYDPTDSVPLRYHFLYSGGIGYDELPGTWKALPYSKIELERTQCLGRCPSYVAAFMAGGKAQYTGRKHSERIGDFDGKVEIWDYGQICWMIERFKILEGAHQYHANWTDSPTAIVRVTMRDTGQTIEISDYGGQGPVELWALFNSLDAVTGRIDWSPRPR